jgi:hypothetical protein
VLPSSSSPSSLSLFLFPSYVNASFEAFIMLELALVLSTSFEVPLLLSSNTTQQAPVSIFIIHRVFHDFWLGCWIDIFGSRSTILHQLLLDPRLSSGIAGVFRSH